MLPAAIGWARTNGGAGGGGSAGSPATLRYVN